MLGVVPVWMEVRNLGDRTRCYISIRICEAAPLEQREVSRVGLLGRSLDSDEQVAVGFSVEILVFISSR